MPLPIGTQKNRADLRLQADTTFKSNGGAGLTKTGGQNERQFIADYLESVYLKEDKIVQIKQGNVSITFDVNAIYIGFLNIFRTDDFVLNFSSAKRGAVAKAVFKRSTPPTITGTNLVLYEAESIEVYDNTKINVYIFRYIGNAGGQNFVEYNRYTIDI